MATSDPPSLTLPEWLQRRWSVDLHDSPETGVRQWTVVNETDPRVVAALWVGGFGLGAALVSALVLASARKPSMAHAAKVVGASSLATLGGAALLFLTRRREVAS